MFVLSVVTVLLSQDLNPFTPKSDFIDFTLSNARRFNSSKGDPLGVKGLNKVEVKKVGS